MAPWLICLTYGDSVGFFIARIARLTRSGMLAVLKSDYIRTAEAKGLPATSVVLKHALKNAGLPIVTIVGIEFGTLLGGTVITETIFAWPGLGRLAVDAIYGRDYPVVQTIVLLVSVIFVTSTSSLTCSITGSIPGSSWRSDESLLVLAITVTTLVVVVGSAAPLLVPHDPLEQNIIDRLTHVHGGGSRALSERTLGATF